MSEDDELQAPKPHENLEVETKPVDMVKDWSSDYFPTSARPIFVGWAIVAVGVIGLCAAVYLLSNHPVSPEKLKKQAAIKERMNIDDEDE